MNKEKIVAEEAWLERFKAQTRLENIKDSVALHHYGDNAEIGDAMSWDDVYYLISLAERGESGCCK